MAVDISDEDIRLEDSIDYIDSEYEATKPRILVFGIGGGGVNAVDSMFSSDDMQEIEFVVANTDSQSLKKSPVKNKILLGKESMRGLGAGMDPVVGRNAAEENIKEIEKVLTGVNMVFLTAGMGGGTGTGAIPVVAKKAKEMGILVVAIVTKPFSSEGPNRMRIAEEGIRELKKIADTLIVVPNQNLIRIANADTYLEESLRRVNDVLKYGVKGITDLITKPGFINLDFADVKTVMSKSGRAMMGTGEASGENKAERAVDEALSNPLLDNVSIKGARGIIINVTGSPDITLFEYDNATRRIREEVDNDSADIIIGNVFDKALDDTIRISIFATGIDDPDSVQEEVEEIVPADSTPISDRFSNNYNNNYSNDYSGNYNYNNNYNDYVNNEYAEEEEEKKVVAQPRIIQPKIVPPDARKRQQPIPKKRVPDYNMGDDDDFYDMGEVATYNEFVPQKRQRQQPQQQPPQKKHGFFSSFFNSNDKVINSVDEDDFDINVEYYNNTPAYLRKKRNN